MNVLIKQAKIIFPKSELHDQTKDILIKNGIIEKISGNIKDDKAKLVKSKNLHVSIGWVDIGASSGEPGYEHRESLQSLNDCAAAGGYTAVAIFPNLKPAIDNKTSVQFIVNATASQLIDFHPIGALSKNCAGEEITEMIDMSRNGAIAFSDGQKSVQSNGVLLRGLEYVKSIDGLIINSPQDKSLGGNEDIHEGIVSTSLGLKANPSISESLCLERDIKLAQYADSKLLVHQVSSKESVDAISLIKDKNIFVSVPYLNLCKTEDSLATFDVNVKVNPPLRSEEDKQALIKGVKKGQIEVITSNHVPLEEELKKKEFVYAEGGAIGLQTCFSALNSYADKLSLKRIVTSLAINPRKVLGIEVPEIKEGEKANLTLFDPEESWIYSIDNNKSKSKNSPFLETEFKGKVVGVINGKKTHFNNF